MVPPFISYITFNRLGLTIRSLSAILKSAEDFEMHILDSNSGDDTWDYLTSLNDSRIKVREHLDLNHGKVYARNLHLVRRQPEQYFFVINNGALIETEGWISKFLEVFEAFPEVGLLGARAEGGDSPPVVSHREGALSYEELSGNLSDVGRNYIPDDCMCLRPGLIKEIGYFCEENYFGDIELSYRVCNHTEYKAGFLTGVRLQLPGTTACGECAYSGKCKFDKVTATCFSKYDKYNKEEEFLQKNRWRLDETIRDMQNGARPVYCASLVDSASAKAHVYNKDWAMSNLIYFIRNAN